MKITKEHQSLLCKIVGSEKTKNGKVVINNLKDIEKFIKKNFPDGLNVHLKDTYNGYHLNRYKYTNLLAAECHALRDKIRGIYFHSYGQPLQPEVVTHKPKDGEEWYEVYSR